MPLWGILFLMTFAETVGDIQKIAVNNLIKSLICPGRLQSAFFSDVRTEFQIIEVIDIQWFIISS